VLVGHLVVLEIMQKRRRREVGIAGQEHGCARNDMRRLFLQASYQDFQRHLGAPRLLRQYSGAAPPSQDHQHHRCAEGERRPGAVKNLEQVGGEKDAIDENQRRA
jgi:hypothetical protein